VQPATNAHLPEMRQGREDEMKTRHALARVALVLLASALLGSLAGCGGQAAGGDVTGDGPQGKIAISGAFALYPMMQKWGEEFQKANPGVQFDISAGGAGKGMADALAGAVDIGMVSRAITPEEEAKGAYWVGVAKDAVFLSVNEKNPVWEDLRQKGITREKLIGMYITGDITTWGQMVDRPEVTDPIHLYTRSDACGASETWAKYLDNKKQEDLKGVAVFGDPGLADAVIKDPLGAGYNNLNYAFDLATGKPVAGMLVVPIDANGNGQVDPDEVVDEHRQAVTAVATGKYPSPPARNLNLVTNGKPTGVTEAFIRWILTDGQQFISESGYIALPPDTLAEMLQKVE
jgi:phosphate transport system substrate-binding protein